MPRLVIYYPVAALVTLFAHVLQNPSDARARSDVKLMNVVVNFLSTLVSDESNGSIRRMLTVCGEFERISKAVIDRAEKESQSKKKRKAEPDQRSVEDHMQGDEGQPSPLSQNQNNVRAPPVSTPAVSSSSSALPSSSLANGVRGLERDVNHLPNNNNNNNAHGISDLGQAVPPDMVGPAANNMGGNPGLSGQIPFTTSLGASSPGISSFQHPFVPDDLWQMPVSLEWDWADMPNGF